MAGAFCGSGVGRAVGWLVRSGLSLPSRCPNVALDQRREPLALLFGAAHRVRVDQQREGRVDMPKLLLT